MPCAGHPLTDRSRFSRVPQLTPWPRHPLSNWFKHQASSVRLNRYALIALVAFDLGVTLASMH